MARHHVTYRSKGKKVGLMSVTRTTTETCPRSCPMWEPCYDKFGHGMIHRKKVDQGEYGTLSVKEFFKEIPNLTHNYRHNEGGDLWNGVTDEHIDPDTLKEFVKVNHKSRRVPIVYTHKAVVGDRTTPETRQDNYNALVDSDATFALNVSVEKMADVDEALEKGLDVVCVGPLNPPRVIRTPKGNRGVLCPEVYSNIKCESCGAGKPLCSRKNRGYAIVFPAHGSAKNKALTIIE